MIHLVNSLSLKSFACSCHFFVQNFTFVDILFELFIVFKVGIVESNLNKTGLCLYGSYILKSNFFISLYWKIFTSLLNLSSLLGSFIERKLSKYFEFTTSGIFIKSLRKLLKIRILFYICLGNLFDAFFSGIGGIIIEG